MKYPIFIVATMILSLLFGFEASGADEPQKAQPKSAAKDIKNLAANVNPSSDKGHSKGNPNRRTWVVYRYDKPEDKHIYPGDAFQIRKTGPHYKLKPLTSLRKRWNKEEELGFKVDLMEVSDGALCGKVTIANHATKQEHIFKFSEINADELEVKVGVFIASQSLEVQCVENAAFIHGGIAHAEN